MENNTELSKADKRRQYMRDYKRRQYLLNPEEIKQNNKKAYHKNSINLTKNGANKYGKNLPVISKIIHNLDVLKKTNPELIDELFADYLGGLENIQDKENME
jgi:hypothetical protein